MKPVPWKTGRGEYYRKRPKRRTPKAGTTRALIIELLRGGSRTTDEMAALLRTKQINVRSALHVLELKRLVKRGARYRHGKAWSLTTATRSLEPQIPEAAR